MENATPSLSQLVFMALNPPLLVCAAAVLLLAGAFSMWLKASYKGYGLLERMEKADKGLFRAMIALGAVYFLAYSYLSVHRYQKLMLWSWDLGIFESLFANALRGDFFRDYRGPFDHFSPALAVYLPFYAILRDPRVLLVLQTAALTLAVWPLYLLAKEVSGKSLYGALAGLLYLLYPLLGSGNLHDFHAVSLSPLAFFSMLLFMVRERWKWYWLCALLLLLVKEGEAVLLFGAGLYLLTRRRRLHGALSMAAAAGWVVAVTGVIMPWITGETFRHFSRYAAVTDRAQEMAAGPAGYGRLAIVSARMAAVTLFCMLPAGFAMARRWRTFLFIFMPAVVANSLSASIHQKLMFGHYGLTVAGAALGAAALAMRPKERGGCEAEPSVRPVFLLAVAACCNVLMSFPAHVRWTYPAGYLSIEKSWNVLSMPIPATPARRRFYGLSQPERFFFKVRRLFPEGATVTAQQNLAAFFAADYALRDLSDDVTADYYLFDLAPERSVNIDNSRQTVIERLEADGAVVRFLDLSIPGRPGFLFFATGDKWTDFYENARRAHEREPDDFHYSLAVATVERLMGLPPTITDGRFGPPRRGGRPR